MCDFKILTGCTDGAGYGNWNAYVIIIIIIIIIKSKAMKSLCWLFLNCTLLRNQNGGWTVPLTCTLVLVVKQNAVVNLYININTHPIIWQQILWTYQMECFLNKLLSLSRIQFVSQIFVGRQTWNGPHGVSVFSASHTPNHELHTRPHFPRFYHNNALLHCVLSFNDSWL